MDARKTILVADDDPDFLFLIKIRLEENGFDVVAVSSGKEALERIKDDGIDAVLLDVLMPGIDGLEVLKKIKRIDKDLPVYILTAFSNKDRFDLSADYQAAGFIVKTGDMQKEVGNIKSFLNMSCRYKGKKE